MIWNFIIKVFLIPRLQKGESHGRIQIRKGKASKAIFGE